MPMHLGCVTTGLQPNLASNICCGTVHKLSLPRAHKWSRLDPRRTWQLQCPPAAQRRQPRRPQSTCQTRTPVTAGPPEPPTVRVPKCQKSSTPARSSVHPAMRSRVSSRKRCSQVACVHVQFRQTGGQMGVPQQTWRCCWSAPEASPSQIRLRYYLQPKRCCLRPNTRRNMLLTHCRQAFRQTGLRTRLNMLQAAVPHAFLTSLRTAAAPAAS